MFQIQRIRSPLEIARNVQYRDLILDVTDLMPRYQAYKLCIGKIDNDVLLSERETLYRDLFSWRDEKLPAAGYSRPNVDDIDISEIVSCHFANRSFYIWPLDI